MGKFSTGLVTGAIIGIGILMLDKKTMKKAKKMARSAMHMSVM